MTDEKSFVFDEAKLRDEIEHDKNPDHFVTLNDSSQKFFGGQFDDAIRRVPATWGEAGRKWVYARSKWQRTSFHVEQGQKFGLGWQSYTWWGSNPAYGVWECLWSSHPRANGPHGPGGRPIPAPSGYVLPGANDGCLVYRIAGGHPVHFSETDSAYATGEIELIINDDISGAHGDGFGDNLGRIRVIFFA